MEYEAQAIPTKRPGVFESVKSLASSVVAHAHTRLALFVTEFAEEKYRLLSLLVTAFAALFLLFTAAILVLFFVIAAFWDTPYRLYAIGGLFVVFLAGGLYAGTRVRTQVRAHPPLFEASLAELYKDRQQLESAQ